MSLNINHIRAMVENSTGSYDFNGYYDNHPYLGLVECIQCSVADSYALQMEFNESTRAQNNMIMENTLRSITEGVEIDYEAITEASKEGLIAKIKKLFDRLKKWVQSIIAKIKATIAKRKEIKEATWEKYKDHEGVKNPNSNATYNGYMMANAVPFKGDPSSKDIKSFINAMHPSEFVKNHKNVQADAAKAVDPSGAPERKVAIAKEMTGVTNLTAGDWKAELNKAAFGEKKDMKYGEGMFNVKTIQEIFTTNKAYETLISQYQKFDANIKKDEAEMTRITMDINRGESGSAIDTYISQYLSLYQEATQVVAEVQGIVTNYHKIRETQAREMLAALVNAANAPKKD